MTNKLVTILGVLVAALIAPTVHASDVTWPGGQVLDLVIEAGTQYARISVSGTVSGSRPVNGCHNNSSLNRHWSFDISTAKGKAILSVATAALLSGATVVVVGAGNCLTVSPGVGVEAISLLSLSKP